MKANLDLNNIIGPLKKINPLKVVLFGSYAYGKPTQNSDVDLLVVTKTGDSFHKRIQMIRPLLPKDKPIDLIVLTPEEYLKAKTLNPLIEEIESKGRIIYG